MPSFCEISVEKINVGSELLIFSTNAPRTHPSFSTNSKNEVAAFLSKQGVAAAYAQKTAGITITKRIEI